MKKLRKLIISAIGILSMASMALLTVFITQKNTVKAANGVDFTYKTYSATNYASYNAAYTTYLSDKAIYDAKWADWNDDMKDYLKTYIKDYTDYGNTFTQTFTLKELNDGVYLSAGVPLSDVNDDAWTGNNYHTKYSNSNPFDLYESDLSTLTVTINRTTKNAFSFSAIPLPKAEPQKPTLAETDSFSPGDSFVIEVIATITDTTINGITTSFDFGANGFGNAAKLSDYDFQTDGNNYSPYFTIKSNSSQWDDVTIEGSSGDNLASGYITSVNVGGTVNSNTCTGTFVVGTIESKISSSASSDYYIDVYGGPSSNLRTFYTTSSTGGTKLSSYGSTAKKITIVGSDTLTGLKVGGTSVTPTKTATIGGNTYPVYVSPSTNSAGTSNTSLTLNYGSDATPTVSYVVVPNGDPITTGATISGTPSSTYTNNTPVSIGTTTGVSDTTPGGSPVGYGTYSINPGTDISGNENWPAGSTLYAIVTLTNSTNSPATTLTYLVEIPQDEYTSHALTGLGYSTNAPSASSSLCVLDPAPTAGAVSSPVKAYYGDYSGITTTLTFTPSYSANQYENIKIVQNGVVLGDSTVAPTASNYITSGGSFNTTDVTNPITITVYAQSYDASTNPSAKTTYTINPTKLSDDVALDWNNSVNLTPYSGTAAIGAKTPTASATSDPGYINYEFEGPWNTTSFKYTPKKHEVHQKVEYSLTGAPGSFTTITFSGTSMTAAAQAAINMATGYAADTQYFYVKVTAQDGHDVTYKVAISRKAAMTDTSISNLTFQVYTKTGGTDPTIYNFTPVAGSTDHFEYAGTDLDYATARGIKLNITYGVDGSGNPTNSSASGQYKLTYGTTTTALTATGAIPSATTMSSQIPYDTTASPIVEQIEMIIEVKIQAEDPGTSATYYFSVKRRAAYDDVSLTADVFTYDGTATGTQFANAVTPTVVSGTGLSRVFEIDTTANTFKYAEQMYADFTLGDTTSTTVIKYSSTTVVAAGAGTGHYNTGLQTSSIIALTNQVETYTIITEANPSGYTLNIKYNRDAAQTDTTLNNADRLYGQYHPSTPGYYTGTQDGTNPKYTFSVSKAVGATETYYTTNYSVNTGTNSKIYWTANSNTTYSAIAAADKFEYTGANGASHQFASTNFIGNYGLPKTLYVWVLSEAYQVTGTSTYALRYEICVQYEDTRDQDPTITNIKLGGLPAGTSWNDYVYLGASDPGNVSSFTLDPATNNYVANITVPYSVSSITVLIKFAKSTSSLTTSSSTAAIETPSTTTGALVNLTASDTIPNTLSYTGQAQNNSFTTSTFVINITRSTGSDVQLVTDLSVTHANATTNVNDQLIAATGAPYTSADNTLHHPIYRSATSVTLTIAYTNKAKLTVKFNGSNITPTSAGIYTVNGLSVGAKNVITIEVLSEKRQKDGGASNDYTLNIYTADQTYTVNDIQLYAQYNTAAATGTLLKNTSTPSAAYSFASYNASGTNVFEVPYKNVELNVLNNTVYSKVTLASNSSNAKVTGDGNTTTTLNGAVGSNPYGSTNVTITVKSEYASLNSNITTQVATYTIEVRVLAGSTVKTLDNLEILIDGTVTPFVDSSNNTYAFNSSDLGTYLLPNIAVGSQISFNFKKTDAKSKVTPTNYNETLTTSDDLTYTGGAFTMATTTTPMQITFEVEAEVGGAKTIYKVKISTGSIVLETTNNISGISMIPDDSLTTQLFTSWNYNVHSGYVDQVRSTTNSVLVTVTLPATQLRSKVYIGKSDSTLVEMNTLTNYQYTLTNNPGDNPILIRCMAEDSSVTPNDYSFKLTVLSPDPNNTLVELKVDGTEVLTGTGFGTNVVKLTNNYATSGVTVYAKATSNYAVLTPCDTPNKYEYTDSAYPLVVGKNEITIYVDAEDTTVSRGTYKVEVWVDESTSLADLLIGDVNDISTNLITFADGVTNGNNWNINVPYTTEKVQAIATLPSTVDASLLRITAAVQNTDTANIAAGVGTHPLTASNSTPNVITVKIEAKSGANSTYVINITRVEGSDANLILTLVTELNETITPAVTQTKIEYIVDRTVLFFKPTITVSPTAKVYDATLGTQYNITDSDLSIKPGANSFTVVVTSQTNIDRTYTVVVYQCDTDSDISDIFALEAVNGNAVVDLNNTSLTYSSAQPTYALDLAYSQDNFYFGATANSSYATLYVSQDGGPLATLTPSTLSLGVGTHTLDIVCEAEYLKYNPSATGYKSQTYTVTIVIEQASSENRLQTLNIYLPDKNSGTDVLPMVYTAGFDPDTDTYTIQDLDTMGSNLGYSSVTTIYLEATVMATGKATIGNGDLGSKTLQAVSVNQSNVSGYWFTYTITVTPETGSNDAKTYTIQLSRGKFDLSTVNDIVNISIVDSVGTEYMTGVNLFQVTQYVYGAGSTIKIPYGVQSFTINASLPTAASAYATLSADCGQHTITAAMEGTSTTYKIYATSQTGVKGTEYQITVEFATADSDSSLATLTISVGSLDPVFTPGVEGHFTYSNLTTLPNSNAGSRYQITASATKTTSKISVSGINLLTSGTGTNTILSQITLDSGANTVIIICTAENGSISTYTLTINVAYPDPNVLDITIDGEDLLDSNDKLTTFDPDTHEYYAIVKFTTTYATLRVKIDNTTYGVTCSNSSALLKTGLTRTFQTSALAEGSNKFTVTVSSGEGTSVEYKVIIQRRGEESTNTNLASIKIAEISQFEKDYTNLTSTYSYVVPNKINSLDVSVVCEKVKDKVGDGATYEVFNADKLEVGDNQVLIVVTSEDGNSQKVVVVNVEREKMSYTVDKSATKFSCTKVDDHNYVIDLGTQSASAITDYTKYIDFDSADNLTVEVLSNTDDENCREVVLRISDGSEEEFVTLSLDTTAGTTNSYSWLLWLLLGLGILILLGILVTVNKDKYGKVSNKRKNA